MDLLYGKEVCGKKLPWQGLELCPAGLLYQKEIEVGERIDLSSNSVATTDISSVSRITDAEDKSYRVRSRDYGYDSSSDEEICKAEDLVEEGTGY